MATIFDRFKNTAHLKLSVRQDGDGNEVKVESREDEEQSLKLLEIIDLLVAAGYFRARIKGLSPFDKVVGGMTWCIESCNIDVDVDLLFHENLTIGQKIALTEKIVSVLPKMQCPHRIEPHQIQGLDFIHIFPIIQWLVKTSMEYRQEMSEFVKSYTLSQFDRWYNNNNSNNKQMDHNQLYESIDSVKHLYRPRRYYRRKALIPSAYDTTDIRVQLTLLEYGQRNHLLASTLASQPTQQLQSNNENDQLLIEQIVKEMTFTPFQDSSILETDIQSPSDLLKHYEILQAEIQDGGEQSTLQRKYSLQQEQLLYLQQQYNALVIEKQSIETNLEEIMNSLKEINSKQEQVQQEFDKILIEDEPNTKTVKLVEDLVVVHENLKDKERSFREYCKTELIKLQTLIKDAENNLTKVPVPNTSSNEELDTINEQIKSVRLQMAKKVRAVAIFQRQLDEIPSRAELAQYQRRFLELYNQVSAKHKETKQYYTLYNTLDDTRIYIRKELTMLNSILDSYPEAMQSNFGKDEFLQQFESIMESVRLTRAKVEYQCTEERRKRDELGKRLLALVEQQRRYVVAVRQLGIECRKNETLLQHTIRSPLSVSVAAASQN